MTSCGRHLFREELDQVALQDHFNASYLAENSFKYEFTFCRYGDKVKIDKQRSRKIKTEPVK
jgi:hypothetical protein